MLIEDVALDTLLLKSLNNVVATVQPLRKSKAHAAYQLRASLISQRREHLRLLGLERRARVVTLHEILAKGDDTPASGNGAEGKEQAT